MIDSASSITDWMNLYRLLVHWEMQLSAADTQMDELLDMQRKDAATAFAKFIKNNYASWIADKNTPGRPMMSPDIFKSRVFPCSTQAKGVFHTDRQLPPRPVGRTQAPACRHLQLQRGTLLLQYSRPPHSMPATAIFSGLMPVDIERLFPDLWVDEDSPEGKNLNESPMIAPIRTLSPAGADSPTPRSTTRPQGRNSFAEFTSICLTTN